MANKLTRVFQSLFGQNGAQAHFGQFGSRVSGPGTFTKDPNAIQALSAFLNGGWFDAINASNKAPFLEDMNGLFLLVFYQLSQIFQDGVPVWDPSTPYFTGSVVRKDGTFELYGSLVNSNIGNALPNQTADGSWTYLNPASVPPGIIADFGGGVPPFGWLLCDGTSYAQSAQQNLYFQIGTAWNTYRGAADPGAGNFRVPDFRGQVRVGRGQAPGLSSRDLAQFIGEETHTLVVGEMPGHTHGVNDGGHQHGLRTTGVGGIPAGGTPFAQPGGAGTTLTDVAPTGISIGSRGGDGAHNNMQPSGVCTAIIKT